MKCPKCGYLGFETGDRCRNCGYDFSLAGLVPPVASDGGAELILKRDPDVPDLSMDLSLVDELASPAGLAPPARAPQTPDLDRLIGLPGPAPSVPPAAAPPVEVSLFPGTRAGEGERPLAMPRALARPPLAVRRATPEVPRVRPRQTLRPAQGAACEAPPLAGLGLPAPSRAAERVSDEASPVRRVAAALVDLGALGAIDTAVVYFTLRLCGLDFNAVAALPWIPLAAFLLLLNGGYFITFAAVGGQTIAQMALGLKVVGDDGTSLAFSRATLRTLAWCVSTLPFGLGLWFALGGDHRTLHDRLTATRVVLS